ncbi:MAG TPA: hypothetical protein VMW93_04210 [bacterium]|nr:hypothetical protein [bacterium]
MAVYQRKGSKTYHTVPRCSKVPGNVKTNKEWTVRGSKPKGKMCVECAAKEKPKAKPKPKPKKTVVKKKAAPRKKTGARRAKRK